MWRVGSSVGRTIYQQVGEQATKDDQLIGVMDTRELAARVVAAVNAAAPCPADVVLVLTVRENDTGAERLEVWQREGRSATEFAAVLRRMADQFEAGDVRRVG